MGVSLSSGAVGAPESRLVLEIDLEDMASLEDFWGRIPAKEHTAWCMAAQARQILLSAFALLR
jgi:hypothetical protein